MPARQSTRAKILAEGASFARGAQQKVKQEPTDVGTTPVRSQSRQILRTTIINRRQARGLEDIHVNFVNSVKHELTPEEMEKKERRKEQNRRAARKCRMKKKYLQNTVADDYSKICEDNQKMEQEVKKLRAEKASLEKILKEHALSGQCLHVKRESACVVPASPATMTSSPSTSSLSSMSSSSTTTCSPAPAPAPTSAPAVTAAGFEVNEQTYLRGLGPILPDQTFTDLDLDPETLIDLAQYVSLEDLKSIQSPSNTDQLPPSSSSSSSSPSFLLLSAQMDPMESLKTLMPASPRAPCISQSPYSPVPPANPHDRHSVSSVTSDWSSVSGQSQGFLVQNHGGSPIPTWGTGGVSAAFGGSTSEPESMDTNCSGDYCAMQRMVPSVGGDGFEEEEDEEDEVFNGGGAGDENLFQQYACRH